MNVPLLVLCLTLTAVLLVPAAEACVGTPFDRTLQPVTNPTHAVKSAAYDCATDVLADAPAECAA